MKPAILFFACAFASAPILSSATVSGKISFLTKRGQHPVVAETLVWLEPAEGRLAKSVATTAEMITRGKALSPHVLAIPVGSTVTFPNFDPISHNLFSLSPNNSFDLGLYRRGSGKSHKFDTPGLVSVYCNVHPNMSAVIWVMDTPYFAFADPSGTYSIPDVPAGRYRLLAWNEQSGQVESPVDVAVAGVTGQTALLLDSRNYRYVQHLDKSGKPYQPPSLKDY